MIKTLTCGPLVYVRTLKCASTFYWESFKKLGWNEIKFHEIDWKHQRVFSHMMDPDQRRYKGLAEDINRLNLYHLFYQNETFKKCIAHAPGLGPHSMSYHAQYGNYCNLIDWIPLTGRSHGSTWWLTHQESAAKTDVLLQHYGIRIFNDWAWDQENRSSDQQKKLEKDLSDLWHVNRPGWANWHLQPDRELYNRVITKFNYEVTNWPESSWLR
jgi:hypothetical protein